MDIELLDKLREQAWTLWFNVQRLANSALSGALYKQAAPMELLDFDEAIKQPVIDVGVFKFYEIDYTRYKRLKVTEEKAWDRYLRRFEAFKQGLDYDNDNRNPVTESRDDLNDRPVCMAVSTT